MFVNTSDMAELNIRNYLHDPKESDCSIKGRLTQDRKDEILEAFTLYDKDGDGYVEVKDLGTVVRALGLVPTLVEETDIVARFAQEKCEKVDFINFFALIMKEYKMIDEENELRESFRRFDKEEKGFINEKELRSLLTTTGEPLTEEEVDSWLEDGKECLEGEKIFYENLATFMLSK